MPEITRERLDQLEKAEADLKTERLRGAFTRALQGAQCRADGIEDAVSVMLTAAAVELDDAGTISKLTMQGKEFESAAAAAADFVGARKYLAADPEPEPGRGPGSPSPALPARAPAPKPTLESYLESGKNVSDLISEGWASK